MMFLIDGNWIYLQIVFVALICCHHCSDTLSGYPDIKYCFSSMDLLDGSQSSNYFILKRDLDRNCTHVYGNIVINNIIRGMNGSEPDLGFLSSIKEITGSLKIHDSNISVVPLTNLRVIRGNSKLYNNDQLEGLRNSLEIKWDRTQLQTIDTIFDFRSLRSVVNGNIKISDVFCNSLANVDWEELLEDPTRQTLTNTCSIRTFSCSEDCPIKKGQRYCWGRSKSECQIFSKCEKRMCANRCFISKNGEEECCNSQCLGGCTSSTADSCIACQGVLDNKVCQQECPPKKIFNRDSGVPQDNKYFRPLFVNICLNKCPDGLLEQEGECKSQCTFRKYERIGNQCVPCKRFCEQICTVEDVFSENDIKFTLFSMDAVKIKKLANCTTFKGPIHIDKETFTQASFGKVPITNARDLWYLNNLRNVSGTVYIDLREAKFKLDNFSFLSNLSVIEGHFNRDAPVSLGIYNTKINFLGLTNLKTIGLKGLKNKPIDIRNNTNLCYFELDKFQKALNFRDSIIARDLADPKLCKSQGKICHEECDPSLGCWGPGPKQCNACRNVKLGLSCAKNCFVESGYLPDSDPKSKICLKCHQECAKTCSGVKSSQCIGGCKHAMENYKCVFQCSRNYYLNNITKTCEPCHSNCHFRNLTRLPICTGPLPNPGPMGCNKCQSFVFGNESGSVNCSNQPFLGGYFIENHPNRVDSPFSKYTEKFTDLIVTYKPCHPLCSKCTFYTDHRIRASTMNGNGCIHCKGYWNENTCVKKCPFNSTFLKTDQFNTSLGECFPCHRQCVGCYGRGNDKCIKCKAFVLHNEKNITKFTCVETCPQNFQQIKYRTNTSENRCEYVLLTQLEFILVIVSMIFFFVLLIFVIIIAKICHVRKLKRQKDKLNAYFSNANERDSNNIDEKINFPNMNQLLVISNDDLEFFLGSEILGKGTFGSVYPGKWKPCENYFDDSSSMNSCKDKKVDVVIKVLNGSCDQNEFMEEVRIMTSVRHKHCLRLIGVCFKGTHKLLISSYMPLGSMDKYLANNKKNLTGHTLLLWAEQIANGMYYLEKNHIIHRDLATRNVLIYKESHVQITDFGLSKFIQPKNDEIKIFGGMVPVRWLAIEALREGIYSHKTDVWAYAVTLWEIFTFAKIPYESIKATEIRDEIIKGTRLCQPEICSLDIYILMLKCWSNDPSERPTFEYLWTEFKMYSSNAGTYLSHPNEETNYKNDSPNNYIDVIHNDEEQSLNNSAESIRTSFSPHRNESFQMKSSPSIIFIPDHIRPILREEPKRNKFYEPANEYPTSKININGSFSKNNHKRTDLSCTLDYLEPLTTGV